MKPIHYIIFIFSLITFISCEEIDESPAEVNMEFSLSGDVDNNLEISSLDLIIDEIKIEADQENGERFTFTETLNEENLTLSNGDSENIFQFNIPPSIYTNISITFNLKENEEGKSMVFNGRLTDRNPFQNDNFPLIFEQQGREFIELSIKPSSGNSNEIVIQRGEKIDAVISIDAYYIFQSINPGLLIAAEKIPIKGVNSVLINREKNPEIYNSISPRVNQSFRARF
ncbi:MAG: hypothetical protein ACQETL_00470 [Bacteroidota bacterium]